MISIDVGATRICVCETVGSGKNLNVVKSKIIPVVEEIITDANVVLNECFAEYMALALADFSGREVAVTFSMLPVISNDFTVPYVSKKRAMDEIVKGKVFQTLSASDYIVDYTIGEIFKQDNAKLCTIHTYVGPRAIVSDVFDIIRQLGKIPKSYSITQDIALRYANITLESNTMIIAYLAQNQIILHLINQPNKIITRITNSGDVNPLFALGADAQAQDDGIFQQGYSQISKLVQYQAIKYPGVEVNKIYIVGECADEAMLAFLRENLAQQVELLPAVSSGDGKADMGIYFYAICSNV